MQENVGDEYQNLSIGSDFAIHVVATQYTSEADDFGNDIDANASEALNCSPPEREFTGRVVPL